MHTLPAIFQELLAAHALHDPSTSDCHEGEEFTGHLADEGGLMSPTSCKLLELSGFHSIVCLCNFLIKIKLLFLSDELTGSHRELTRAASKTILAYNIKVSICIL